MLKKFVLASALLLSLTACHKKEEAKPEVNTFSESTVTKDVNGDVTTKTITDDNGKIHTSESHSHEDGKSHSDDKDEDAH